MAAEPRLPPNLRLLDNEGRHQYGLNDHSNRGNNKLQSPPPPPPPTPPPLDEEEAALKRATAIHNEQVKLASTAINNSAVNLITVGVITPIVALGFGLAAAPPSTQITLLSVGGWIAVAYILRSWAHSNLERLR